MNWLYFEEGSAAAVGLESRDPDDRDVIEDQWTGIHLDAARQQSGKVLDVPNFENPEKNIEKLVKILKNPDLKNPENFV